MSKKVELRNQRISDAKRFYEILKNPNFIYLQSNPENVEAEKKYLQETIIKRKNNIAHEFTITYDGKVVGGCGIKIDQHRKFIGEIGYFVDEDFWGKSIATKAVKKLEKIGFNELGLKRIEILMDPRNIGSEKVAIKSGYKKEGTMQKSIANKGKFYDAHLYAKVK